MRLHVLSIALCLVAAAGAVHAENLKEIQARMDKTASDFKAMTASVVWTTHTAALNENSEESGTVTLKRVRPGDIQGLVEFIKPDSKFVSLEKQRLAIYYPKTKTQDVWELGEQADQLYQFLMIGFGTSGTALAEKYNMKDLGKDTVKSSQGIPTIRLQLVPKNGKIRENYVSRLELWIPVDGEPYPVQEKISFPNSDDYRLVVYKDLRINPALGADALQLKLPPGVHTEKHSGK